MCPLFFIFSFLGEVAQTRTKNIIQFWAHTAVVRSGDQPQQCLRCYACSWLWSVIFLFLKSCFDWLFCFMPIAGDAGSARQRTGRIRLAIPRPCLSPAEYFWGNVFPCSRYSLPEEVGLEVISCWQDRIIVCGRSWWLLSTAFSHGSTSSTRNDTVWYEQYISGSCFDLTRAWSYWK